MTRQEQGLCAALVTAARQIADDERNDLLPDGCTAQPCRDPYCAMARQDGDA